MLRSSSIIGGASVINIFIGLVRIKVAAVLLGPAGIGLIGIYQSLILMASTVSSMGFNTAGARQISEAAGHGTNELAAARRGLFWGTLALALIGGGLFWVFRQPLATYVLNSPNRSDELGWLAIGVILMVASGSQTALLRGMRKTGDMARVAVFFGVTHNLAWNQCPDIVGEKWCHRVCGVSAHRYLFTWPLVCNPTSAKRYPRNAIDCACCTVESPCEFGLECYGGQSNSIGRPPRRPQHGAKESG